MTHYLGNGYYLVIFKDGSAVVRDDYDEFVSITEETMNKLIEIWQEARKKKE